MPTDPDTPDTEETAELIASDKVAGTAVFDSDGERLGAVHNFMVDKRSGHVAYAVLSFGGFLGLGQGYRALPWSTLRYNTQLGGYVVTLSREALQATIGYDTAELPPGWQDAASPV